MAGAGGHRRCPGGAPRGRRQLRLERRSVAPARAPDQSAPREIATGPELAIGWGRSWAEVAEQAGAAFQASAAEADLRGVARSAAGDARTREDIVRRLVAWVHQNVRCTGVLLGEAPFPRQRPRRRCAAARATARMWGCCS